MPAPGDTRRACAQGLAFKNSMDASWVNALGRDLIFGTRENGFSGWSKAKAELDARITTNGDSVRPWRLHCGASQAPWLGSFQISHVATRGNGSPPLVTTVFGGL